MEHVQLRQMNAPPTPPPPPPPLWFPGRIHMLRMFGGKHAMCVRVFACAHAYREAAIKRENGLFEVSEEVGHVIVQPCVLVHAWGRACMALLQNECGCACMALWKSAF